MQITPENAQKVGMVGAAVVLGGYLIGYYYGQKSEDCGCSEVSEAETRSTGVTRGTIVSESFGSEMTQDMSGSAADLNRINPTVVEGAEDIMGAESYQNLNPLDYQTPAAFSDVSVMLPNLSGTKPMTCFQNTDSLCRGLLHTAHSALTDHLIINSNL